jgi:hypothetical protein
MYAVNSTILRMDSSGGVHHSTLNPQGSSTASSYLVPSTSFGLSASTSRPPIVYTPSRTPSPPSLVYHPGVEIVGGGDFYKRESGLLDEASLKCAKWYKKG